MTEKKEKPKPFDKFNRPGDPPIPSGKLKISPEAKMSYIQQSHESMNIILTRLLDLSDLHSLKENPTEADHFQWKRQLHNDAERFCNLMAECMRQDRSSERVNHMRVAINFLARWTTPTEIEPVSRGK